MLKYLLTITVSLLLLAASANASPPPPPPSLMLLKGCSAVCVSPTGIVVTAKHCEGAEVEKGIFVDGTEVELHRLYVSSLVDGAVVYEIARGGAAPYPYSPIGTREIRIGEDVYCWGFPRDGGPTCYTGELVGLRDSSTIQFDRMGMYGDPTQFLDTTLYVAPGVSGGPLFSEEGEVIGLSSTLSPSLGRSDFTNLNDLHTSYTLAISRRGFDASPSPAPPAQAGPAVQQVEVYVADYCDPCHRFLASTNVPGAYPGYTFRVINVSQTPVPGVTKTPSFNAKGRIVGMDEILGTAAFSPSRLRNWLDRTFRGESGSVGRQGGYTDGSGGYGSGGALAPVPGSGVYPPTQPLPPVEQTPAVKVVITVPKLAGEVSGVYGELTAEVLDVAVQALERQIKEAVTTVEVHIIPERSRPTAYKMLHTVAGGSDGFHVFLGVAKADLSWWQAGPAALVESAIQEKLGTAAGGTIPVSVLFERTNDTGYFLLGKALDTKEAWWDMFLRTPFMEWLSVSTWITWAIPLVVPAGWLAWVRRAWILYRIAKPLRGFVLKWTSDDDDQPKQPQQGPQQAHQGVVAANPAPQPPVQQAVAQQPPAAPQQVVANPPAKPVQTTITPQTPKAA